MHCQLAVLMAEKDQKLSQRKLSRDLGIALATVNKLYNGRPMNCRIDPDTVERICNYFECEIGDLFVLKAEID